MKRLEAYKGLALTAAFAGGQILMRHLSREMKVGTKGRFNLITEVDHLSEQAIVRIIHDRYPGHQIIAEEGHGAGKDAAIRWLVDPLDGTTNYAHRFPFFCVSIGLEVRGEVVLGVVYDPCHKELFLAEKGRGAFLNGQPISVSKTEKLEQSLMVTGFNWQSLRRNFRHFMNFSLRVQGVRRTGSAALDLCYVANGRLDGYWELNLSPWDMAAGGLIVAEAGGKVTHPRGGLFSIYTKEVLASNGRLHAEMVSVLRKATPRSPSRSPGR